jgi:hypothetical protein
MDQPALDQRLGTVGADPPCCSRTARSRIDHRYSRKRRRQAASTDIPQIKEGSTADRTTLSPRREATTRCMWWWELIRKTACICSIPGGARRPPTSGSKIFYETGPLFGIAWLASFPREIARTPALSSLEAIKAAAVMFSVHKITHSVLLSGEMPCRSTSRVVVSLQTLSRAC